MPASDILDDFDPETNYLHEFQNSTLCDNYSVNEITDLFRNNKHNMFNILCYNVRSFGENSNYFLPMIESASPSIFVATETWFTDSYQSDIDGYNAFHTIRSNQRSGGISAFVADSLNCRKIDDFCVCNSDIEICTVEIKIDNEEIYFFGIYRFLAS